MQAIIGRKALTTKLFYATTRKVLRKISITISVLARFVNINLAKGRKKPYTP